MQHNEGSLKLLQSIATPAYVADIAAIKSNMAVAAKIKERAGVKILLATKAFSMFAVFDVMRETLDGTTASGAYEARLGAEHFGSEQQNKEVHCYSPAYTEKSLQDVSKYSDHIYFNSIGQLKRYAPALKQKGKKIGLRVNPQFSQVKNSELYDPSALNSRFGVLKQELDDNILNQIDILHIHNLCENGAEDSVALINHISENYAEALERVSHVNLGGGHYITHPNYEINALIEALKAFKKQHKVDITLEIGGALVLNAGYLVSTVLDIIEREPNIVILDTSASAHMPDVLEVPYTPHIIGATEQGAHTYILGGQTCMTGDVIGTYSFDHPLQIGDTVIFTDMMQYSMVKNTTFNGMPLPDIGILHEDGTYERIKSFGYEDFKDRLS